MRFRSYRSERYVGGNWVNAITKINHYGDDTDEPRWITEDTTQPDNITRNITGPDGHLAATTSKTGDLTLQMTNLHGDIMATVPLPTTTPNGTWGATTIHDTDEYGIPHTTAAATARYSWLGQHQRSQDALADTILMGARLYHPTTGRFLSVDPIRGGSATDYDYGNADPINTLDLDGRCPRYARHPLLLAILCGGEELSGGQRNRIQRTVHITPLKNYTNRRMNDFIGPSWGYRMYGRAGQVYKYGVTSQRDPRTRPERQLSACAKIMKARCTYTRTGTFNSKQLALNWERARVKAYRSGFGRCPAGNREPHYGCR